MDKLDDEPDDQEDPNSSIDSMRESPLDIEFKKPVRGDVDHDKPEPGMWSTE